MTCNMFYYVGRRALEDITNQGGEVMDGYPRGYPQRPVIVRTGDC